MDPQIIKKIIEGAQNAPSGDNSQPWNFSIKADSVEIRVVLDKDNPYLNFGGSGTYIAGGAILENIYWSAHMHGYEAHISLFPTEDVSLIAKISFEKKDGLDTTLSGSLSTRHTNRTAYTQEKISDSIREKLISLHEEGVNIHLSSDMETLAWAGSRAEVVILENKILHALLFNNVVWSKKEETLKREGLFVDTLEFIPPQKLIFFLCRKWGVMSFFNKFGFAKFIAFDDAKKYKTGDSYLGISVKEENKEHFVRAGRVMERAWLLLEKEKLSAHPITATLFFGQRIRNDKKEGLRASDWNLLEEALEKIRTAFQGKTPIFMMRIGRGKKVQAQSSKKHPIFVS